MAVSLVAVVSTTSADTPTVADFAACNADAQSAVRAGSATPTAKDHLHAEAARKGREATAPYSLDPQVVGMDVEGTTDAAYQAAYRTCMRRRGF